MWRVGMRLGIYLPLTGIPTPLDRAVFMAKGAIYKVTRAEHKPIEKASGYFASHNPG